jgi:hypothetical protein
MGKTRGVIRMIRWFAVLALAACGFVDYPAAPVGRFDGTLFVMWVGETQDGRGDGRFVFVPSEDPLTFTRTRSDGTEQAIRPEMMYTDGGSIPALAQVFNGFSPWGYAPAYMVHDWLFVARKCLNDGQATETEMQMAGVSFQDSAVIAAEAIKTLIASKKVTPNDVAPGVISSVVAGPIARQLWQQKGACAANRIAPEHLAMIRRALPGIGVRSLRQAGPAATIIQAISF